MSSLAEAESEIHHKMATPVAAAPKDKAESDANSYDKSFKAAEAFNKDKSEIQSSLSSMAEALHEIKGGKK